MPRIPEQLLDVAIYLYRDERSAHKGANAGGSGFMIWMDSEAYPGDYRHFYAVTNKHVVEGGDRVVRLNTREGVHDSILLNDWVISKKDDLAIALVDLPAETWGYHAVSCQAFITKEIVESERIGPGDDTFLIGRFVNHEGRQRNLPCVRSGNLAMMADEREPVLVSEDPENFQEAFLVELRTKCGFSGSPVFVNLPVPVARVMAESFPPVIDNMSGGSGPWLLGVHQGQVQDTTETAIKNQETDTGMAIVIPAWCLTDLLNDRSSVMRRTRADERFASRKSVDPVKLESAKGKQEDITKEDFEKALKKASRKIPKQK